MISGTEGVILSDCYDSIGLGENLRDPIVIFRPAFYALAAAKRAEGLIGEFEGSLRSEIKTRFNLIEIDFILSFSSAQTAKTGENFGPGWKRIDHDAGNGGSGFV